MGKKNKKQKRKEKERCSKQTFEILSPKINDIDICISHGINDHKGKVAVKKIENQEISNLRVRKQEINKVDLNERKVTPNKNRLVDTAEKNYDRSLEIKKRSTCNKDNVVKINKKKRKLSNMPIKLPNNKNNDKLVKKAKDDAIYDDNNYCDNTYPYPVDYCDHFETSLLAYEDILPAISSLAKFLGKNEKKLKIYDPYYCAGSTLKLLNKLGFENVIHRKRDFYADIKDSNIPDYDLLITNPPYSEDHKERCIKFCVESNKPWILLMPNYVTNKQYYRNLANGNEFYISPKERYEYDHPEGTGHETSPFFSFWYLNLDLYSTRVFLDIETKIKKKGCKIARKVEFLEDRKLNPTRKRLNSKRRKKLIATKRNVIR